MISFSFSISHTPWRRERVDALKSMLNGLETHKYSFPLFINDVDLRGKHWQDEGKVELALRQWEWHTKQDVEWHVLATDDLELAPKFVRCLGALLSVVPFECPVGFLSNHPRGPSLAAEGFHWYATNSWLVGPMYALHRTVLPKFLAWYKALPDGPALQHKSRAWYNDDSALNEFVTHVGGGRSVHPLPTIIEHRADLESTVGHGDRYSRERFSWRVERRVRQVGDTLEWTEIPYTRVGGIEPLTAQMTWLARGGPQGAPMLAVGGE